MNHHLNISISSKTALHIASWRGHANLVALLLEHPNIDISIKEKNGKTALDMAREAKKTECVRLLEGFVPYEQRMKGVFLFPISFSIPISIPISIDIEGSLGSTPSA